jgi:hypothetical protein
MSAYQLRVELWPAQPPSEAHQHSVRLHFSPAASCGRGREFVMPLGLVDSLECMPTRACETDGTPAQTGAVKSTSTRKALAQQRPGRDRHRQAQTGAAAAATGARQAQTGAAAAATGARQPWPSIKSLGGKANTISFTFLAALCDRLTESQQDMHICLSQNRHCAESRRGEGRPHEVGVAHLLRFAMRMKSIDTGPCSTSDTSRR